MNILIRADANAQIGSGHIMRCLALSQAFLAAGDSVFLLSSSLSDRLRNRLADEGVGVLPDVAPEGPDADLEHVISVARRVQAEWVVIDGYRFTTEYQQGIKDAGFRLLCIDDYGHAGRYVSDVVLNQNLEMPEQLYRDRDDRTCLLLGPRYALLRKEFRPWKTWQRSIPDHARKVLVTFGGADPSNCTLKAVHALSGLGEEALEVKVLIGHCSPHVRQIREALQSAPFRHEVLEATDRMPELMAWADLAVSGGGSTTWEMAFMGLPNIVVILAENQRPIAQALAVEGVSIDLGWHETVVPESIAEACSRLAGDAGLRSTMSERGRSLVDGQGVARVCAAMRGKVIVLRDVVRDDGDLLHRWVNDADVRRVSFQQGAISLEEHRRWFHQKLGDIGCVMLIATTDYGRPVGQIRFDCWGGDAEIDVSVARDMRGQGYGAAIIRQGVDLLRRRRAIDTCIARVKKGNEASIRAFQMAGFCVDEAMSTDVDGVVSLVMSFARSTS